MSIVTAKVFRQQIMNPAEGLFLFHPRAIERLIEGQLGARLAGVSIPHLPYYLMPKADFLFGLETENAEALSVIEGLRLPGQVILLPSPPEQTLEPAGLVRLRHDYWARAFEAEVARAWQTAREDNQDQAEFGATALTALIGAQAFAEVREVLARDGLTLPIWEDDLVCRAFVATVVRLRYFATGARGFFFPAIQVWPDLDRWLVASGLDLPPPRQQERLPMLLTKSRPGGGGALPPLPLLPLALPYGRCDPDLPPPGATSTPPPAPAAGPPQDAAPASVGTAPPAAAAWRSDLTAASLAALARGSRVQRRRRWAARVGADLRSLAMRVLGWFAIPLAPWPAVEATARPAGARRPAGAATHRPGDPAPPSARPVTPWRRRLGLALFARAIAAAQRAEFDDRFALALRRLADARRILAGLFSLAADGGPPPLELDAVDRALGAHDQDNEAHLAALLAARWRLPPAEAAELRALVGRLAAADRAGYGNLSARLLLGNLEQVLRERRDDYYRLRLWPALGRGMRHRDRLRQVLPFQGLLKSLRALASARLRLEDLPWPLAELERASALLDALTRRVTDRLDADLTPRLVRAMAEADFVPRDHRERIAAQKMQGELFDIIKQRRHLKFTDVRDVVARNILRLPDPTLAEFLRGDRLRRFDRTAARALPGVYRPGEFYIKGLQQLGAPLFGTDAGRAILRYLLLPFGAAFVLVKSLDMLWTLVPGAAHDLGLTNPTSILVLGGAANLFVYTEIGRHLGQAIWSTGWQLTRFLLWDGPRGLLRWPPLAELLATGFVRGLGRNLIQPMLIGSLPLIPIIALAVFVEEVPLRPGLWLVGLAFAIGTLARNTPGGRRFLDDLTTGIGRALRRLNQTLIVGLITQLLYFFKEVTRRFAQVLHRVDETLTPTLAEPWTSTTVKALLAPVWRLTEALIQFYVTVLVEPQVNPVKHFPIVSVGHKIMLPFLPAITVWFVEVTHSVLPAVIAYPLVTLTIILLPGLFGFLVWELKENYKLYQANHVGDFIGSRPAAAPAGAAPTAQAAEVRGDLPADLRKPIEPALIGAHGETLRAMMTRGFHSGALPKAFDRLRRVIREQQRDARAYPKRLRRCQRQLREVGHAIGAFVERELIQSLRDRSRETRCTLGWVEADGPRLATNLIEFQVALHPRRQRLPKAPAGIEPAAPASTEPAAPASLGPHDCEPEPVRLDLRLALAGGRIRLDVDRAGEAARIGPHCWRMIDEDLRLFAGRAGARDLALRL